MIINKMPHYCYILWHQETNMTYNGYTNNLERRLRQHNGELSGGARSTSRFPGGWQYLFIITSEELTYERALSLEWHIRFPTNKRPRPRNYQGAVGRIEGVRLVLENPKFGDIMRWKCWVHDAYRDILRGSDKLELINNQTELTSQNTLLT